jgi:hypothetical protein
MDNTQNSERRFVYFYINRNENEKEDSHEPKTKFL